MKKQNNTTSKWPGYNIDQLRYLMALNKARREITKVRVMHLAADYHDSIPIMGGKNSIFKRMLSSLSLIDYAVITYNLTRKVTKIVNHIRGK